MPLILSTKQLKQQILLRFSNSPTLWQGLFFLFYSRGQAENKVLEDTNLGHTFIVVIDTNETFSNRLIPGTTDKYNIYDEIYSSRHKNGCTLISITFKDFCRIWHAIKICGS